MIGSGAWACAAIHIVAQNCERYDEADEFTDEVRMWVYEEEWQVNGPPRGGGAMPSEKAKGPRMSMQAAQCARLRVGAVAEAGSVPRFARFPAHYFARAPHRGAS